MTAREEAVHIGRALTGKRVRVHTPELWDAARRALPPGPYHGRAGTVLPVGEDDDDQYTVGNSILLSVRLDDGRVRSFWDTELRDE